MDNTAGSVLVVGAGIGGIRAALDLAETGYYVYLIDNSPHIGGVLAQLDYQFPNNHCGMCKMLPLVGREDASQFCMRKSLFHDRIKIMPFTELRDVTGEPGAFEVGLTEKSRQVDVEKCIGCGKCVDVCPVEVADAFNEGLTKRKAVYRPVPHNLSNLYLVDQDNCNKCGQCMIACPTSAIDLFLVDTHRSLEVSAIILAGGAGFFDPTPLKDQYGCGDHPNVMASLAFERLISGVGPTHGALLRPSDGKEIQRIAWLQCVGSRNLHLEKDYCSSICCMFALKEAVLAKEVGGEKVDAAVFYMDMRSYGKEFYRYQREAENDKGVRLVRSRVHTVTPANDGDLSIRYVDDEGGVREEVFDLVVLSAGQCPQEGMKTLAEQLGIELNQWEFAASQGFSQVHTANPGVFVCGSMTGLKDISEALVQAGAAAASTTGFLVSKGQTGVEPEETVEERDVSRDPPRIGMILCKCMGTMEEGIDFEPLKGRFETDRSVERIVEIDTLCSDEGLAEAFETLSETDANRLLIGACLPYVYRQKLRSLAPKLGLNPALVEIVDLRSVSFSGNGNAPEATKRAEIILATGLETLKGRNPLHTTSLPVAQKALVVGGGIAGMTAALTISQAGYPATLVEETDRLGGQLHRIYHTVDGTDPRRFMADTVKQVEEDPMIQVLTETKVVHNAGSVGGFQTILEDKEGNPRTEEHGIAIIATGAREAPTEAYCFGESDRIMTQEAFEENLAQYKDPQELLNTVVMIQCVGSRDEQRPYCSRICCASALKNASRVRERNKDARIYIFYRDIMAYGFLEQYYTRARAEGVKFIPYTPDKKPEVALEDGKPVVRFDDPIMRRPFEIKADTLVLSTGMVPADNGEIAEVLSLKRNEDGFMQEADSKWRPVDFIREGIYLCGTAHSPRSISESIAQAQCAAERGLSILSKEALKSARAVADVKTSLCTLCETCIALCPFEARFLDDLDGRIVVDQASCQACGACSTACPSGAAFVRGMEEKQTMAVIEAALEDALTFI